VQEMPGVPGEPVVTTLVCLFTYLHARLRVHRAPGISCALLFSRDGRFMHNPGDYAPRDCRGASGIPTVNAPTASLAGW
jgi:hypothetical protein